MSSTLLSSVYHRKQDTGVTSRLLDIVSEVLFERKKIEMPSEFHVLFV